MSGVCQRGGDDAVVGLGLALALALNDLDHPENAARKKHARIGPGIVHCHRVERIPVIAPRSRDESPVERIDDTERQRPRNSEHPQ
jgi:hypothetical protein